MSGPSTPTPPDTLLDLDATFLPVAQMRQLSRVTAVATPRLELRAEVRSKRHLQFGTVDVHAEGIHVARVEAVLAVLAWP